MGNGAHVPNLEVAAELGNVAATPVATGDVMDPRLKYDTRGPKPILLIPQPSDDPNDPLVRLGLGGYWRSGRKRI